jgi:hypothetical protein
MENEGEWTYDTLNQYLRARKRRPNQMTDVTVINNQVIVDVTPTDSAVLFTSAYIPISVMVRLLEDAGFMVSARDGGSLT